MKQQHALDRESQDGRAARILLYAFTSTFRNLFSLVLTRFGYTVEIADNREQLIEHLTSPHPPELVFQHADAHENWPNREDRFWNAAGFSDGNRELFQLSAPNVKRLMLVETRDLAPTVPWLAAPVEFDDLLAAVRSQLDELPRLYIKSAVDGAAPEQTAVELSAAATDELIARCAEDPKLLLSIHWRAFEELVARIFERHGYDVTLRSGTKDGGVDVVALHRDGLADALFLVQCKHVKHNVGVKVVRELYGVSTAWPAAGGIVVTTASFTADARRFADEITNVRLKLHDFERLVEWTRRLQEEHGGAA